MTYKKEIIDDKQYIERLNIVIDGYNKANEPDFDQKTYNDIIKKLLIKSEGENMELKEYLPRCYKALEELQQLRDRMERGMNELEVIRLNGKIEGLKLAISYFEEVDFCQEYNICWKEGE